jgi:hypothetical protein
MADGISSAHGSISIQGQDNLEIEGLFFLVEDLHTVYKSDISFCQKLHTKKKT